MKKRGTPSKTSVKQASAAIIGRKAFAKISAVEGIAFTPAMKRRADEFDRKGMSAEQRRRAIISAHRKG